MSKLLLLMLGLFSLTLGGCSSVFIVKSDPIQADVSIQDIQTGEKKMLGKTPLEMPANALRENMSKLSSTGEYFALLIEKQGFESQRLLVPGTRFGTLVTQLDVKMKQGLAQKEEPSAKAVLSHLFLAQKLANAKQYERAQIENDKVLLEYPGFPRAYSMRASIYYMQKNLSESLKWYEEALKADPQMDDAVQMISKIRTQQAGGRIPASNSSKKSGG